MKIKTILVSLFALAALTNCAKEPGIKSPTGDSDAAFLNISIEAPKVATPMVKSSSENPGTDYETKINTLYLMTFNSAKKLVHHKDEQPLLQLAALGTDLSKPKAARVTAEAKYIFLIANPGPALLASLGSATKGDTYESINSAVTLSINDNTKRDVLANEIRRISGDKDNNPTYSNFTMVNSGGIGLDGLTAIDAGSMYYVGPGADKYPTEQEAEDAANNGDQQNPKQKIKIERLAAKIMVGKANIVEVPAGASFTFGSWTLDVLNSTFFPYAEKKAITGAHNSGGFYSDNFYTVDPNYATEAEALVGIKYNKLRVADREPIVTWLSSGATDYCIENTMDADEQRFQATTRVVIKGTYYPVSTWTGDWYSFAGTPYETLALLQAAYAHQDATQELIDACNNFHAAIANNYSIAAADFSSLTQAMIDNANVVNGGDLVKGDGCIKWYQNGRNYYYYEIRHDNDPDLGYMAFGKYGVVRNNFYALTLTKVKGPGKPWYPGVDPIDPDPEGPEPPQPIDDMDGFISFTVDVAPWIYWTTDFEI